jgi:predicted aspartyl protease
MLRRLSMLGVAALLAGIFAGSLHAQTAAPPVPSTPLPGAASTGGIDPEIVTDAAELLAFANLEERMTVPVLVNGAGPYRFILDTGSERTVISREVASALALEAGPRVTIAAMTGSHPASTVRIPSLAIDALPHAQAIEAPALMAAHLGADGLIGIDTLDGSAVLIDFEKDEMHVQRSRRMGRLRIGERAGDDEIVVRGRPLSGRLIVTDAYYAGRRIAVVLDTGTSISVGNSHFRTLVDRRAMPAGRVQMLSVTGRMLDAEYRVVPRIEVGGATFQRLGIAFADVPPFKRLGLDDRPALFLGMDALRLFRRVRIDVPNREVRFLMPREVFLAPSMTMR